MSIEQAAPEASAPSTEVVEPVAPAAAAAESATAPEGEAQVAPSETTEVEGSEPAKEKELGEKGKAEIIKLRKRAQDAERLADYLRGKTETLEGLAGGKTERKDTAEAYPVPRPIQQEDEDYEAYRDRVTEWTVDKRGWASQQESASREFTKRLDESWSKGVEAYEDYAAIVPGVKFYLDELKAIALPNGEHLAYFLTTHPEERSRINSLDPFLRAVELGSIRASIASEKAQPKLAVKRISTAPEPAPRLKGSAPVDTDSEYMSDSTPTARRIELSRARQAAQRKT